MGDPQVAAQLDRIDPDLRQLATLEAVHRDHGLVLVGVAVHVAALGHLAAWTVHVHLPEELAQAVTLQEAGRIIKVPGIGKKTAERLLLELKGKLGADIGVNVSISNDSQSDILQALVALGYSDRDAALALKALPKDIGVSDGIKLALKALAK